MHWQFDSDTPIYLQLVEKIRLKIAAGEYAAGMRLPAVRDFALETGVNPNTMQRALTELERLGLVYSQRTAGRFVTEDAERIARERNDYAAGLARQFSRKIAELGFTRAEMLALFEEQEGTEECRS